jgi:hypothetical protein
MPTSHTSPDIRNYYIGKGTVEFLKDGDTEFVLLGNVPSFEFTPDLEKLEHFSSQEGVKSKDRTVVISKKGTITMVMEEFTAFNLALMLLSDVDVNTAGQEVLEIFSVNAISGQLKFTGTNEVGPQWQLHFLKVDFIPGSSLNPISDEWGQLEVTGDVSTSGGSFGTATLLAVES